MQITSLILSFLSAGTLRNGANTHGADMVFLYALAKNKPKIP
jgi:hypothetical protein